MNFNLQKLFGVLFLFEGTLFSSGMENMVLGHNNMEEYRYSGQPQTNYLCTLN